jgi:glycogen(starch) synthase
LPRLVINNRIAEAMKRTTGPSSKSARRRTPRRAPRVEQVGAHPALVFEVSWEACCQTGGIYTVLRSKAPATVRTWGENYWLIGPYREESAKIEFEAQRPEGVIADTIAELNSRGVETHCGRWLITGRPRVLLMDLNSVAQHLNEMKYYLWKDLGIGTPPEDNETDGIVLFGYAVADFLQILHTRLNGFPLLAQFHEWQGGLGLPLLKHRRVDFATIFTTHATLVGRSLSAANIDLYDQISQFDAEVVAKEHGILPRFQIERAAAQAADTFTTVSEITAEEAANFLGRAPEVLLPNGLNVERAAAPHEFQNLHQECKERIHDFVRGHFFPSYTFDLERTLYVFTAGRYEYRNKGLDVFIDSLYELNRRLRARSEGVTVVAFIITRAPYRGPNVEALNRQAMFHELRQTCEEIKEDMGRTLFDTVSTGRLPTTEDLLDEYARVRLKRMMHAWRQGPPPTIVTHDLDDDAGDPVLLHLRRRRLLNLPDDPVKVVFHPEFITSTSPILGMEYDDFVRGCNLGVFPSYYEPWGYTPLECVVRGVPAVTSDLAGFGAYLMENYPDHDANGMFVARRRHVSLETTVYQVAGWLHMLTRMPLRDRIAMRNRTEQHADHFDWTRLGRCYRTARAAAFKKYHPNLSILPAEPEL